MSTEIGLGLIGFGTVGSGVIKWLQENGGVIEKRTGYKFVLHAVADVDLERDRGVVLPPGVLTRDAEALIRNDKVQIVIELVGGLDHAKKYILHALSLGKPVVTANKALLAESSLSLFQEAAKTGTDIFFEASVGGGVPVIRALRDGLVSNRVSRIYGILNGTCNYILGRMESAHATLEVALKEAQEKGFAEADPSLDLEGIDTAHKAVILASLACGFHVPMDSVSIEGIRHLAALDMTYAADLGYRIKLMAVIEEDNGKISVRVHPALVPHANMLASVSGVFNAILMRGDGVGDILCCGIGAGRDSTASAILSDVAEAARNLTCKCSRHVSGLGKARSGDRLKPVGETNSRYYLRLALFDKPGMFGQVATILGKHDISIASVLQKENCSGKHVPVIFITHYARENAFRAAVSELDALPVVGAKTVCIRIEDF